MRYTVTVDTEEEWDWDAGWPMERPQVTNIQALPRFQEFCARHGARPTYFVDLAVLDDVRASRVVEELAERDDAEIGMHIHPWNTPPIESRLVRTRETFLHNLPDELIEAKLTSVYRRFVELGLRPTSFRGGRYSSGGRVTEFLREHGFVADASVLPLTTWPDEGAPDYRHRELRPVRLPPRQEGDQALWEIPLTLAFTRRPFDVWRRWYELVERTWLSKLRVVGIGERLGLVRKAWLNFESPMCDYAVELLRLLARLDLPCVCFTVHSSSLVAGKGPYTRTAADEERVYRRMSEAFDWLAANGAVPVTMTELAEELEAEWGSGTRESSREEQRDVAPKVRDSIAQGATLGIVQAQHGRMVADVKR